MKILKIYFFQPFTFFSTYYSLFFSSRFSILDSYFLVLVKNFLLSLSSKTSTPSSPPKNSAPYTNHPLPTYYTSILTSIQNVTHPSISILFRKHLSYSLNCPIYLFFSNYKRRSKSYYHIMSFFCKYSKLH